jgi:NADPH:quinone reductase-like Zn-dependent oxidoreductase
MFKMRAVGWPPVVEVDVPQPGHGQVKVKVAWSAVNQADLKVSSGEFAGRLRHARSPPLIGGYDFSGSVEGDPGIGDLRAGGEVFGFQPARSIKRFAMRLAGLSNGNS